MNLLPIIKCKLQELSSNLRFLIILIVIASVGLFVSPWISDNSLILQLSSQFPMTCAFACLALQAGTLTSWESGGEFWYGLPFSKSQIFLTHLLVQQIVFLVAFSSLLGVLLLTGVVPWGLEVLLTFTNTATCSSLMVIWLLCIWKPKDVAYKKTTYTMTFIVVLLVLGVLSTIALFTQQLGPWPTYIALVGCVIALFILKRSLNGIEPLTGEQPLFEMDVPYIYQSGDDSIRRPNASCDLSSNADISESVVIAMLTRRLSPLARYVAKTVWLNGRCVVFFLFALLPMSIFCISTEMASFGLWFVCIAGMNMISFSNKQVRALSSLPIGNLRLFLLVCGPYFAAMIFIVLLPCCFGYNKASKDDFYVGLFARTSIFFFFLLGIRLACWGGVLVDTSQKPVPKPSKYKSKAEEGSPRRRTNWMQRAERVIVWLGLGVVILTWFNSFSRIPILGCFDFRAFLLNHYFACWVALLLGIYTFCRMSLQVFRRVY